MGRSSRILIFFALSLSAAFGFSQTPIAPQNCLAIGSVGGGGRSPIQTDEIQYQLVKGTFVAPKAGDTVQTPSGRTRAWKPLSIGKDGWFASDDLQGGYAYFEVVSENRQTMMLEAAGQGSSWINGVIRGGDPYAYDYLKVPVELHAGRNQLLFSIPRGRLSVRLSQPLAPRYVSASDPTLPDLRVGTVEGYWGGVVVVNASQQPLKGASITTRGIGLRKYDRPIPEIPPMSVRKVPMRIETDGSQSGKVTLAVTLNGPADAHGSTAVFPLDVKTSNQTYKKTFISTIDGSVQYYAVVPATDRSKPPALVLTLHGASVEAIGQANAYSAKSWADIVAPTNRRPYGFDWEDWGRLDAMEVLGIAKKELGTDPTRTYLTGHSMGGHGTWQVGVTFPDQFAAIAPSAGWISFFSYAGTPRNSQPDAMTSIFQRAANSSDTLALSHNYLREKIYILHGDKDDNVPVTEARTMRDVLAKFHPNVQYHEQPGAGHWWGNECVDWKPIFDLFQAEKLPYANDASHFEFFTANPAVSARCYWVTIVQQDVPLGISSFKLDRNLSGDISMKTDNVVTLDLDTRALPNPFVKLTINGQILNLVIPKDGSDLFVSLVDGKWRQSDGPASGEKTPLRGGPFKQAFGQRFVFVYGTGGTKEENDWMFQKARYDSEVWMYRANGSVDIVADRDFDVTKNQDRSVIVYGNSSNNSCWDSLLGHSPIQIGNGIVRIGRRDLKGTDLACIYLRPRPGSASALVGVVSGSGLEGMRATDRLPYFTSGVGYPDFTVLRADYWQKGLGGVECAGFFGNSWELSEHNMVWRDPIR